MEAIFFLSTTVLPLILLMAVSVMAECDGGQTDKKTNKNTEPRFGSYQNKRYKI